jgi:Cd2+/Zn2+-exporting ATPase
MDLPAGLMAIGFTEYEARVYLALLRENPTTGYGLSKKSGVPRSMVYEALGRLDARGAVLKSEERRATLYRPVPPDALLDRYLSEHRQLVGELRSNLLTQFNTQDEELFWSITGRSAILAYALQMIDGAASEALLVLSDQDLTELRASLELAHQRGITISILLTGESDISFGQVAHHPPLESELQELEDMLVVVVDKRTVLIASTDIEMTATVSSNPNLMLLARQFVWMELFAQRVYARLGPELLARLEPEDRQILEVYAQESDPGDGMFQSGLGTGP